MTLQDRINCIRVILDDLKPNGLIDGKNLYDLQLHFSFIEMAFVNSLDKKDWMNSGKTEIGSRMNHIVHDVVDASCIQGIIMNDVIRVFSEYGYKIVKNDL